MPGQRQGSHQERPRQDVPSALTPRNAQVVQIDTESFRPAQTGGCWNQGDTSRKTDLVTPVERETESDCYLMVSAQDVMCVGVSDAQKQSPRPSKSSKPNLLFKCLPLVGRPPFALSSGRECRGTVV